jgi:membrane protease YdiL (CAAX protease family)
MTFRQHHTDDLGHDPSQPSRIWLPVTTFVAITFVASAACQAAQGALGIDPTLIAIVQFAPALGAVVTVLLFRGSTQWCFQFVPGTFTGGGALRIGAAVAAAGTFVLLTVALCGATGIAIPVTGLSTVGPPVVALLVAQFVGACGEELGWRCFLQPTLGTRAGPVTTGAVVGLIWGLWHVQVIALGPWYLLAFLAATIGMSIVLALLLHTRGSPDLLVAGLFHFLINIALLVVLDEESGDAAPEIAFAVAALVVAACAVIGRYLYQGRQIR